MKFLVQRVKKASVEVEEKIVGKIDKGFLVLIGVTHTDTKQEADYLIKKLIKLRVFEDENQKMNLDINQINGELLLISQFTLLEFDEKTYLIQTTPGTEKMKIIAIEELPTEISGNDIRTDVRVILEYAQASNNMWKEIFQIDDLPAEVERIAE